MGALNDATKTGRTNAPRPELSSATSSYQGVLGADAFGGSEVALPEAAGHIECSDSSVTYVGNAHWRALLESVCMTTIPFRNRVTDVVQIPGLQDIIGDSLQASDSGQTAKPQMPGPLSGTVQQVDRAEILSALPPRDTVDMLLQQAFVNTDIECSEFSVEPKPPPADSRQ